MTKKILVVEDDPAALRFVSYILEAEGYEIITAVNGVEALRKAQQETPDLVVLDIMLPGIDGFEVCHRMRSDPESPQARMPILMLTAKSQEADREMGRKVGGDHYVAKPATPEEVTQAVKMLLAQREEQRA
jgi:DNA-binding response OmpR family regulator